MKMMEIMQKILYVFGILGIPSIFTLIAFTLKKVKADAEKINILMSAQQAQMRSQLLKDYYHYKNRGFIYESELQDWMNQYEAYHTLGANGVMDNRKDKLMSLETKEEIL